MVLAAFVYCVNNKMTSVGEIELVDESLPLRKVWKTLAVLQSVVQSLKNRFKKSSWVKGVGSLSVPLLILTSTIIQNIPKKRKHL